MKEQTKDELINEAVSLIMKAEDWQIVAALEAALNCQKKSA